MVDRASYVRPPDWEERWRCGELKTPYKPYAVIAEGTAGELRQGYLCPPGRACMSLQVWAATPEAAQDVVRAFGDWIRFSISRIYVYNDAHPTEPPLPQPSGYDARFMPEGDE